MTLIWRTYGIRCEAARFLGIDLRLMGAISRQRPRDGLHAAEGWRVAAWRRALRTSLSREGRPRVRSSLASLAHTVHTRPYGRSENPPIDEVSNSEIRRFLYGLVCAYGERQLPPTYREKRPPLRRKDGETRCASTSPTPTTSPSVECARRRSLSCYGARALRAAAFPPWWATALLPTS